MIDKLDVIKDKLAVYKIWLLLGGIILIGCIIMIVIKQPKEVAVPTAYSMSSTSSSAAATSISSKTAVMIDVKGAVKNPGVYDIVNSPRAQTAIAKAGGLTHEADTIKLNLAQKLSDGQMLYVPVIGEVASNKVTVDQQGAESGQEMTKINLNTATAEELQTLEGVGEKKAEQIIAYREAHDGFKKLDEIKEVSGIGAKRFETMQDKITI
ncbi:helix-hairpin-helix domain-containing protein [Leuconostoc gelidum subsp. gasicomitatum]|uniref:helix-hairpin-helix domain-containing protein n=1 Tax=Leuconostoc gelidum group TaxID=3016637 RepID=UPI00027E6644|nr:helix-hairpin-helix domain-containing protein [Leuconostoc gelidum]AFS39947.1 ComE operon protein 1 [Leuconostoc gelidum JB7]MBZ5952600.1 helix-hairpin-helix domain-containing protein [Leuconostoc gasicomitatum]